MHLQIKKEFLRVALGLFRKKIDNFDHQKVYGMMPTTQLVNQFAIEVL